MASNGFFSHQRNAHHRNANAGTMLKRRNDNRDYRNGDYHQEEQNRYAPPQKRFRSQTQFRSDNSIPLYHHHHVVGNNNNVSRVSESYDYGRADVIASNTSFALHNNNYQKPFVGYRNPNPQIVPIPLPYRNLNDEVSLDSLPEWVPNQTLTPNTNVQAPVFTNENMASIVTQSMMSSQPIVVSKELSDLLNVLSNEKEKETSVASNKWPVGLSFDDPSSLKVRHESVISSLYSDMPRQCSSCGVRFKCQEDHSKHMDWHARKNRMAKSTTRSGQKPQKSRGWLASSSLWLVAATGGGSVEAAKPSFGETQKKKEEEEKVQEQRLVPADENQKMCALCEEAFEEFFSHEADDWMYKDAAYLTKNGPIVHSKCMPEPRPAKDSREPRNVMSVTVPSIASAIVC